jgi:hypothetical protein
MYINQLSCKFEMRQSLSNLVRWRRHSRIRSYLEKQNRKSFELGLRWAEQRLKNFLKSTTYLPALADDNTVPT